VSRNRDALIPPVDSAADFDDFSSQFRHFFWHRSCYVLVRRIAAAAQRALRQTDRGTQP
jgi:hypothetical protein